MLINLKRNQSLILLFLIVFTSGDARGQTSGLAQSCNDGDLSSCNALAIQYVSQGNYQIAVQLLSHACDGGLAIACSNLAEQYYDGLGVALDLQKAALLFAYACTANEPNGCAGVCVVANRLNKLTPQYRPECESRLTSSCSNGNSWMCQHQLTGAGVQQGSNQTCQGQDLANTANLIERIFSATMNLANAVNFMAAYQNYLVALQEANNVYLNLPVPCQVIFTQWANYLAQIAGGGAAGGGGSGGAPCMGGVCCDSSGCYD